MLKLVPRNWIDVTCFVWLAMLRCCSPVSKFQTLIWLSAPALARSEPSAFQLTPSTWCVCPSKDRACLPERVSKTFTNLSAAQLARYFPSREKSTLKTVSLCASLNSRSSKSEGSFQVLSSPLREGSPPPV